MTTTNIINCNIEGIENSVATLYKLGNPDCGIAADALIFDLADAFNHDDAIAGIWYKWNFVNQLNGTICQYHVIIERNGNWGAYNDPAEYAI